MYNEEQLRQLVGDGWYELCEDFFIGDQFKSLMIAEKNRRKNFPVYPEARNVFRAFRETPLEILSVVYIAQDPYHTPGKATGLATGVEGYYPPPTLKMISQEIKHEFGQELMDLSLQSWAHQGVLLLNRALSVVEGKPKSNIGYWKPFTNYVVSRISATQRDIVFLLLGKEAQELVPLIDPNKHDIVTAPHPMAEVYRPGSGFLGSMIFQSINDMVENAERPRIQWHDWYPKNDGDLPF